MFLHQISLAVCSVQETCEASSGPSPRVRRHKPEWTERNISSYVAEILDLSHHQHFIDYNLSTKRNKLLLLQ